MSGEISSASNYGKISFTFKTDKPTLTVNKQKINLANEKQLFVLDDGTQIQGFKASDGVIFALARDDQGNPINGRIDVYGKPEDLAKYNFTSRKGRVTELRFKESAMTGKLASPEKSRMQWLSKKVGSGTLISGKNKYNFGIDTWRAMAQGQSVAKKSPYLKEKGLDWEAPSRQSDDLSVSNPSSFNPDSPEVVDAYRKNAYQALREEHGKSVQVKQNWVLEDPSRTMDTPDPTRDGNIRKLKHAACSASLLEDKDHLNQLTNLSKFERTPDAPEVLRSREMVRKLDDAWEQLRTTDLPKYNRFQEAARKFGRGEGPDQGDLDEAREWLNGLDVFAGIPNPQGSQQSQRTVSDPLATRTRLNNETARSIKTAWGTDPEKSPERKALFTHALLTTAFQSDTFDVQDHLEHFNGKYPSGDSGSDTRASYRWAKSYDNIWRSLERTDPQKYQEYKDLATRKLTGQTLSQAEQQKFTEAQQYFKTKSDTEDRAEQSRFDFGKDNLGGKSRKVFVTGKLSFFAAATGTGPSSLGDGTTVRQYRSDFKSYIATNRDEINRRLKAGDERWSKPTNQGGLGHSRIYLAGLSGEIPTDYASQFGTDYQRDPVDDFGNAKFARILAMKENTPVVVHHPEMDQSFVFSPDGKVDPLQPNDPIFSSNPIILTHRGGGEWAFAS